MSAEDAINEAKSRIEAMLAPINGGVGEDASYDELFEGIKTEIDKVNALEGGSTDWGVIRSNAEQLLSEKSKDFRVALYFGASAAQKDKNVAAVLDGIVLLLELCNAFWEPMFPALKRPRARGLLCGWYTEVVGPVVQGIQPTAGDRSMVQGLSRSFRELDGLLADKLGDAYPGMMSVRDQIALLERRVPADAPPPPPPPPPPAPKAAPAPRSVQDPSQGADDAPYTEPPPGEGYAYGGSSGGGGLGLSPQDVVDPDSAYRALAECAPLIARAADVFVGGAPTSADGYRLRLTAAWLMVGGIPYNEGGRTQIDGPYEHVVAAITDLASAQDWTNLLTTASQVAADHPLFLDAARGMVTALEGLGGDYDVARQSVTREIAALLARAPGLADLTFANGVAFASPDTKSWLGSIGSGGGGGGARSPVDKAIADAQKLVAEERGMEAIQLLSRAANQSGGGGPRFKARLEVAKVALKLQLVDVAKAQLESLERTAEEHRLAVWDPELAADFYANVYRVQRSQLALGADDGTLAKESGRTFQKVCELDAALALRLSQEATG
jgi:type VI secretion system protein VasJ